jgi:hypothetical protein
VLIDEWVAYARQLHDQTDLPAGKVRLQDLDEALRKHLAWSSIVADKEKLNLDPHQARQAETQRQATKARSQRGCRKPTNGCWLRSNLPRKRPSLGKPTA